MHDGTEAMGREPDWSPLWEVPIRGWSLVAGVLAMIAAAVVCWPAALSYGAAILATHRRRYRSVAWLGVVLGLAGLAVTVVFLARVALMP